MDVTHLHGFGKYKHSFVDSLNFVYTIVSRRNDQFTKVNIPDDIILPSLENVRSSFYHIRAQARDPNPVIAEEAAHIASHNRYLTRNQPFFRTSVNNASGSISLLFLSNGQLANSLESSEVVFIDATFKVVPRIFKQLLSIHFIVNQEDILATDAGASAVAEPCRFIFKPRPLPENFNSLTFKEKRKYVENVKSKFRSSNKKLKRAEAIANDNRLRSIPVAEFPNVTPSEMGLVAESFQPCTEIQILTASTNANGFHNTPVTEFPNAAPSEISLLVSSSSDEDFVPDNFRPSLARSVYRGRRNPPRRCNLGYGEGGSNSQIEVVIVSDDEDTAIAASLECRPTVPGISEEGLNSKTEIIVLTETERSERHCSICLQILKVGRKARLIKICGHIGCVGCFAEWLKTSSRCPRCNQSL